MSARASYIHGGSLQYQLEASMQRSAEHGSSNALRTRQYQGRQNTAPPTLSEDYLGSPEMAFAVPWTPSPRMEASAAMLDRGFACQLPPPPPISAPPLDVCTLAGPSELPPAPALPPRLEGPLWRDAYVLQAQYGTTTYSAHCPGFQPGANSMMGAGLPSTVGACSAPDPTSFYVKNTFIDGGADLKRILQEGRQVRSCPGSRLTSPRGSGEGGCPTLEHGELEVVSSSQASTVDPADADRLQRDPAMEFGSAHGFLADNTAHTVAAPAAPTRKKHVLLLENAIEAVATPNLPKPAGLQIPTALRDRSYGLRGEGTMLLQPRIDQRGEMGVHRRPHREDPKLGSPELPSMGSLGHDRRRCKPCAFAIKGMCAGGMQCGFCHLCGAGEKKRRRKEKRVIIAATRKTVTESECTSELGS